MPASNLETLNELEDNVLREVVREAERRLDAQLATANAADQRAMSWAALLVTVAAAIVGGAAALLTANKSLLLAFIGISVALVLGVAVLKAIDVVRPKDWHFPGNLPRNWIPEMWQCAGSDRDCSLREAMIEQAVSLDEQISDNTEAAKVAGEQLKLSMDLALFAVVAGAILVGLLVVLTWISGKAIS